MLNRECKDTTKYVKIMNEKLRENFEKSNQINELIRGRLGHEFRLMPISSN